MKSDIFLLKTKDKTLTLVLYALLAALLFLFSFTPLGMLRIGIVEILIAHLPMLLALQLLPFTYGCSFAILFGLCRLIYHTLLPNPLSSFWFSPFAPVVGQDKGSPLALLVNFAPVVAICLLTYLWKLKWKQNLLFLWAAICSLLNTTLVLSLVYVFWHVDLQRTLGEEQILYKLFIGIATSNGFFEALVAALVIPSITLIAKKGLRYGSTH